MRNISKRSAAIRISPGNRIVASFLIVSILNQVFFPSVSLALTSGPAQEEYASFEPASTSDMVDLFSGDFTYNIPLLSVPGDRGGYPINLSYHSGVGVDQEASWVGLGWNINMGAVNRQLQGIPDDFKKMAPDEMDVDPAITDPALNYLLKVKYARDSSDYIHKTFNVRPTWNVGLDIDENAYREKFGFPDPDADDPNFGVYQVYYNSNKGIGCRASYNMQIVKYGTARLGVGLSYDTQGGIGVSPNLSASAGIVSAQTSLQYNSRMGYQGTAVNASLNVGTGKPKTGGRPLTSAHKNMKTKYTNGIGIGISGSYTFNNQYDVPTVTTPIKGNTIPFTLRLDFSKNSTYPKFGSEFPFKWSGFYSQSKPANNGELVAAPFGYLYNEYAGDDDIKDFQREGFGYTKRLPNLPPSKFTYDIFTISGQGTGGTFRPYRGSIEMLSDGKYKKSKFDNENVISTDETDRATVELGYYSHPSSLNLHVGAGFVYSKTKQTSGAWVKKEENTVADNFNALPSNPHVAFEPFYFMAPNDKVILKNDLLSDNSYNLGGEEAVTINAEKNGEVFLGRAFQTSGKWRKDATASSDDIASAHQNLSRQPRSMHQSMLTAQEVKKIGYSRYLYKADQTSDIVNTEVQKKQHIGEFTILQNDGMRYIYGLPAYNTKKIDRTQSIEDDQLNVNTSNTNFSKGDYKSTYAKFLSQTEIDPYAHSWLLTSVLSSDYVDQTNDGPSDDDFGYWVKFTYDKMYSDYKWRFPYTGGNVMLGSESDTRDDMVSYSYGEKEIIYLSKVETKTHVAIFETSERRDAKEAASEDPSTVGRGTRGLYKLDKITLYARADYEENKLNLSDAVPIKTVHFEYDYSLCPSIPNNNTVESLSDNETSNDGGKLTLKKVWFTYQNSTKGKLSPYQFSYSTGIANPSYDYRNVDRWGNYQANTSENAGYPYSKFPYTIQRSAPLIAWTLNKIQLPTGGVLNIEFEPDDYAYEEEFQATQMFDIVGVGSDQKFSTTRGGDDQISLLNDNHILGDGTDDSTFPNEENYRVYFKLDHPVTNQEINDAYGTTGLSLNGQEQRSAFVYDHFIRGLKSYSESVPTSKLLYFTIKSALLNKDDDGDGSIDEKYFDQVNGYGELAIDGHGDSYNFNSTKDYFGLVQSTGSGDYDIAYVTLKGVKLDKGHSKAWTNPMRRRAMEHLRFNRSELVHNSFTNSNDPRGLTQITNFAFSMVTSLADAAQAIMGFYLWASLNGKCEKIQLNGESKLKLCNPRFSKYGGGSRVKQIALSDNWGKDPSDLTETYEYGQIYDYTTEERVIIGDPSDVDGTVKTIQKRISSGVAYEPMVGKDESALSNAILYENSLPTLGKTDQQLFIETPLLRSHYPGANVGYSKVTVKSINADKAPHSAAPISEYEFYTGKDFPVKVDQTPISTEDAIFSPLVVPLFSWVEKHKIRTQGYSVVTNDMHGKMKSMTTKKLGINGKRDEVIGRTSYEYHTKGSDPKSLNSEVKVLRPNGQFETAPVGQKYDMFVDMHENRSESESFGGEIDVALKTAYPFTPFYLVPLPEFQFLETSFKTITTMKVIHKVGLLKSQTVETHGSKITTENLAFDEQTGEVLLSKVNNEYEDDIYNQSYPAHQYYKGMSSAYENQGIEVPGTDLTLSAGVLTFSNGLSDNYLFEGDEIIIVDDKGIYHKAYVLSSSGSSAILINNSGVKFSLPNAIERVKILRSGHRNQLIDMAGGTSSKKLTGAEIQLSSTVAGTISMSEILNASAVEYSEKWQTWLSDAYAAEKRCCSFNDYAHILLDFIGNYLYTDCGGRTIDLEQLVNSNEVFFRGSSEASMMIDLFNYFGVDAIIKETRLEPNLYGQGVPAKAHIVLKDQKGNVLAEFDLESSNGFASQNELNGCGSSVFGNGTLLRASNCFSHWAMGNRYLSGDPCAPDGAYFNRVYYNNQCAAVFPEDNIYIRNSSIPIWDCGTEEIEPCVVQRNIGDIVNPFRENIRGNFRPKKSYIYLDERSQNAVLSSAQDLQNEGSFSFTPFNWGSSNINDQKWTAAAEVTKINPYGFEVENRDALNIYNAAQYGYEFVLPVAIGNNLRYKEIGYDGFEDYPHESCDIRQHFWFDRTGGENVVVGVAHTGTKSLQVQPNSSLEYACGFSPEQCVEGFGFPFGDYRLEDCDNIGRFSPKKDNPKPQKFILSYWVSGVDDSMFPSLEVDGVTVTLNTKVSKSIDGWRKIEVEFSVPMNSTSGMSIKFTNSESTNMFIDDIRIHPFDANMKSFVYDVKTLKPLAELDENNFATFYVYDAEGQLIKIKKETEEGIKTISEGRTNTVVGP